ncbi:MAG TPA: SDR family NAD(P)-dependent oxidoreductase [Burkholderiaceae bacterium]|nr:SDR family NAD(P)-dependent oxidoreductase [Burkholderiaceae bacterium]
MARLADKVAIVTGAASGFGAEIARMYAARRARVVLAEINDAGAQQVATPLGDAAAVVRCDVTRRADIDAVVEFPVDGGRTV